MMKHLRLARHAVKPVYMRQASVLTPTGLCVVCGNQSTWQTAPIINEELARTWEIDQTLVENFSARESMFCQTCGCSFRLRQLAETLTYLYGGKTLQALVKDEAFASLAIAEINSCGTLHATLKDLPALRYSEYGSQNPAIPSENLQALSYADGSLDLVLTSDTLEHVPDVEAAMKEIRRTLKPGGRHVFTVPIIWSRSTRQRTGMEPSYHGAGEPDYMVVSEFGCNFIDTVKRCGFNVQVYGANVVNLNDVAGVIIATRTEDI